MPALADLLGYSPRRGFFSRVLSGVNPVLAHQAEGVDIDEVPRTALGLPDLEAILGIPSVGRRMVEGAAGDQVSAMRAQGVPRQDAYRAALTNPEGFSLAMDLAMDLGPMGMAKGFTGLPSGLKKAAAEDMRYVTNRNPRKAASYFIKEGLAEEADRESLVDFIKEVKEKQNLRMAVRQGPRDPLDQNWSKDMRQRKVEQIKRRKRFFGPGAASEGWAKNRASDVDLLLRVDDLASAEREARRATLDAVMRRLRAMGFEIRHTSKAKSGKVSSRYVVLPDGSEVRISDHYLPDTPARFDAQISGRRPRWANEIVVDDWRDKTIDDYINDITGAEPPAR